LRLGLVSRVVPRRELDQTVDEVVSSLMELSPSTLMLGKDSFHGMADSALDTALDRLQGGLTEIASTDDAAEGVAAFIEKRAPDWSGR
jgi:enoyl-CoA hydratase/carnithine racemase